MNGLFHFPEALPRDPAVEAWFGDCRDPLQALARDWFAALRNAGADVRELLHDGHPTACVGAPPTAFAYVDAFKAHVNLGFFRGAELEDSTGLLMGTGKYMRHVKLSPDREIDAIALRTLIDAAYEDMRRRLQPN
ncbi:MAG: DUF1801 domain-containing protein [bacterium]|nr:DUF1801 domain-containing protein [bacterium]